MLPKLPPSPMLDKNTKIITCPNHPLKKAQFCLESCPQQKLCLKCVLTLGAEDNFIETQKLQKKQCIQEFIESIKKLKNLHKKLDSSQIEMHFDKARLADNFKKLIQQIQQKQQQMSAKVIECYNKHRNDLKNNINTLLQVQKSLDLYTYDVHSNYQDILNQLKFPHFVEVIDQYNQKIGKINKKVQNIKVICENTVTIYLPFIEIEKCLRKGIVQCLQSQSYLKKQKKRVKSTFKENIPHNQQYKNLTLYS